MKILVTLYGFAVLLLKWYIMCNFWGWFIVPVFALPMPTYWQMAGVSYTVALFNFSVKWTDLETHSQKEHALRYTLMLCVLLMGWGIGYLISLGV